PGPRQPKTTEEETEEARAEPIPLRPFSRVPPRLVAIGCSTGGPQALQVLVRGLTPILSRMPVAVTQHMPPTFTAILPDPGARAASRPAHEAVHGEPLKAGTLYIAPGGKHLRLERQSDGAAAVISDEPPVHFCKPAVDPLFQSA